MDVFDLAAKITLDDSSFETGLNKAKQAFSVTAKAIGVSVAAGAAAVAGLTKKAVQGYAEYEQLVGGVETLFGAGGKSLTEYAESMGQTTSEAITKYAQLQAAQEEVLKNASVAYKTAGMSANKYMETVTSFSASLIQSLDGDTKEAARLANQAIIDMSDNANKMGTDVESIQNAYAGFAKQNYTMLDNLKLGYGGTKSEMERLLADADALSESFNLQKDAAGNLVYGYNDIVEAIHIVQTEMGITGTTAEEADKTIQGSLYATKAAWENLVSGFANPDADIGTLISNMVDTGETALENLIPAVETAMTGISTAIEKIAPVISEELPSLMDSILPSLIAAAASLVGGLVESLPAIISALIDALPNVVTTLFESFKAAWETIDWGSLVDSVTGIFTGIKDYITEHWEEIKERGSDILSAIGEGVTGAISSVGEWLNNIVTNIGTFITEHGDEILEHGASILTAIGDGFVGAIGAVWDWMGEIASNILKWLVDNTSDINDTGDDLLSKIGDGFVAAISKVAGWLVDIPTKIAKWIIDNRTEILQLGANILDAIGDGLIAAFTNIADWMQGIVDSIVAWFSNASNIDKIKQFGKDIINDIGKGISDMWASVSEWAGDIFDHLVDGATNVWSKITGFGEKIVNSIWDGIKSVWDDLKAWLAQKIENLPGGKWIAEKIGLSGADSAANGLDYVPGNNYPALLHKGEAVLTRQEADDWRAGRTSQGAGMTVNIYTNEVSQETVDYIIAKANVELGGQIA